MAKATQAAKYNPYQHWTPNDLQHGLAYERRMLASAERSVLKRQEEITVFLEEIARRDATNAG